MNADQTARYRKKPIPVEARQLLGSDDGQAGRDLADWCGGWLASTYREPKLGVPTLEGDLVARVGDWVVKGPRGEFWPVRGDIFAETYEPAASAPVQPPATPLRNESTASPDSATAAGQNLAFPVPHPPAPRASALTPIERSMLNFALDLAQDRIFYSGPEFTEEDQAAVNSLRRMAGEEQPAGPDACSGCRYVPCGNCATTEAQPPCHRWYTEQLDPVANQWAPGWRFTDRSEAVDRYRLLSEHGTPAERRFVRETTSYTVEAPR